MKTWKILTPATALLLAGCAATTSDDDGKLAEARSLPSELRLVGEPGPGATISAALAADGVPVSGAYSGRAEGLRAFCSGAADGLALSSDLDDAERTECLALGGGWSALSGPSGAILYSSLAYADALVDGTAAF